MMAIKYKEEAKDCAKLVGDYWEGMKSGVDSYPAKGRM